MTLNILVCDDNATRAPKWKSQIETHNSDSEVRLRTGQELAELVIAIGWEELKARGGEHEDSDADQRALADITWADVIVIDSDLSPTPEDLNRIPDNIRDRVAGTLRNGYGDSIARQLRSYTDAGLLVVVNMFWSRHRRPRVFDLTLMQAARAFADVHVSESDLDDPSFWAATATPKDAYRPWQRPVVSNELAMLVSSVDAIDDLDARVFEALALDLAAFSPEQLDFFGELDAAQATFRQLAESPMGFRYIVEGREEEVFRRMAASVVRRWLQRVVVPAQNVLTDAPHLAERFWQFMLPEVENVDNWDALSHLDWAGARASSMATAVHDPAQAFVSRPVFELDRARTAARNLQPAEVVAPPDLGFAEDTSSFHPREDLEQYSSEVPGNFRRRWICQLEDLDVAYEPVNRLLL